MINLISILMKSLRLILLILSFLYGFYGLVPILCELLNLENPFLIFTSELSGAVKTDSPQILDVGQNDESTLGKAGTDDPYYKSILLWIGVVAGAVALVVVVVWLFNLSSDTPPAPITPIPDSPVPIAPETPLEGVPFEEYTKEIKEITSDYLTIKQEYEMDILAIESVRDGFNNYHSPKTIEIVDKMNLDSQVYQQHQLALNTPLPESPVSSDSSLPQIVINWGNSVASYSTESSLAPNILNGVVLDSPSESIFSVPSQLPPTPPTPTPSQVVDIVRDYQYQQSLVLFGDPSDPMYAAGSGTEYNY